METTNSVWEQRLRTAGMLVARLCIAYLFFTQLFWKLPPTFGCPADFSFTTANEEGRLQRTTGLCDWLGVQEVWSQRTRLFLTTNIDNSGGPELAINLSGLAQFNGWIVSNIIMPNIQFMGWIVWLAELTIFVTLFLGLFSRFGALVAIGVSGQLTIGLAGITSPYEWEWAYIQIVVLSIVLFAFAPGRQLGIDAWLRPRLQSAAENGSGVARFLWLLT